jgi:hypothetical protein
MKKTVLIVIGILIISGFGAIGTNNTLDVKTKVDNNVNLYSVNDLCARKYLSTMYPQDNELNEKNTVNQNPYLSRDYPIGTTIWQYFITGGSDDSVKAITPIEDINGDGIDDVIVCSEDNNVRCFSGGVTGTGVVLWTHNIYSGNIYHQNGLTIMPDINGDGYQDIVVGSTGGARNVSCISGLTGSTIWTYDTHEYPSGGWVYQVNCRYDYNNDGILDVLAIAGSDPDRAFCLNGVTGAKIWDYYLGGPGFGIIGVEDFTGDGKPDVVAGCANDAETIGYAKGINGQTGAQVWSFATPSGNPTGVWAVEQVDDVSGDGIKDVMVGDFLGHIYGLSTTNGAQLYSNTIGSAIITRFVKLDDVNGDGHPDIVPAHSTIHTTQVLDGQTGNEIWSHSVADQPWNPARIADITGDNINDVLIGTLYTSNYCYFLNGADGSELVSPISYGEALDGMGAIPDVVEDGSWEMVAGGRNGKLTCISGGLNANNNPPTKPTIDGPTTGIVGVTYDFTLNATDPDENDIYYYVDWNDGTNSGWVGPFGSGVQATISHKYIQTSTYNIRAKAKDEHGYEGAWSDSFTFIVGENQVPSVPEINGTTKGKPKIEYTYKLKSTDPNNDDVYYYVDWGDGSNTGWIGPFTSGEEISVNHTWAKKGTFKISARAKDVYNLITNWATLEVTIPRIRSYENILIKILFERFPRIIQILGFLLNF